MWIELGEEVWPARKSLTDFIFATEADWQRGLALLPGESWEFYRELYPQWRMLVVRKDAAQRWRDAGLAYQEHEQADDDDLPPELVRQRDRELIDYWWPILPERRHH